MGKSNYNVDKKELEQQLAKSQTKDDLEKMKREMAENAELHTAHRPDPSSVPMEDLRSVGQSEQQVYDETCKELYTFLQKIGDYAFSSEQRKKYFPNNKLLKFFSLLKKSGLELQARSAVDMFKTRLKERNGGKMPVKTEKKGFFGKAAERPYKLEEILKECDLEVSLPESDVKPLGAHGTQVGLMKYAQEVLLENEEIQDPLKKTPRKTLTKFLQVAGLLNAKPASDAERFFVACLVTPDSVVPKSKTDRDNLTKYRAILKKGHAWLDKKLEQQNAQQDSES